MCLPFILLAGAGAGIGIVFGSLINSVAFSSLQRRKSGGANSTFGPKAGERLRSLTFDGFTGAFALYFWFGTGSLGMREAETSDFAGDLGFWMMRSPDVLKILHNWDFVHTGTIIITQIDLKFNFYFGA